LGLLAQPVSQKKAAQQFDQLAYVDVIKTYEKMFEKGIRTNEVLEKLGDAYYFKANLPKAYTFYELRKKSDKVMEINQLFRYIQTLLAVEKITDAENVYAEFKKRAPADKRAILVKPAEADFFNLFQDKEISVTNLDFNSEASDYNTFVWKQKIYFTSAREDQAILSKKHSWTGERYTDIYVVSQENETNFTKPQKVDFPILTSDNESSFIFNHQGNRVFYTSNNDKSFKKNKNKTTTVGIYTAAVTNGKVSDPVAININTLKNQIAHPAIDEKDTYLYFAADFENSLGASDLYRVAINAEGQPTGKPENLGNIINTEGRETFPFIYKNMLFFASDGQAGFGGLDIFASTILPNGTFTKPENLGNLINSTVDDFALFLNSEKEGYFTSNRAGGKGNDDLYHFKIIPKNCFPNLTILVKDLVTNEIIENTNLVFSDATFQNAKPIITSEKTTIYEKLPCEISSTLEVTHPNYETVSQQIAIEKNDLFLEVMLTPKAKNIAVGDDLAKVFEIKEIFFDLDKWDIRQDAANELEKILSVMQQYTNMKIDIRSHTDARATSAYNLKLSENRAQATRNWLVKQGIESKRLTAKGYGESQLVNRCADGVDCTDTEHQQNRRSEFIVIE
jgi:outer membrane protein OmpA-like peptidoglycan-associated protein